MDDEKRNLQGSPANDAFKRWHKELGPLWGTDIDFVFVEKNPYSVVACIDFKRKNEGVTFSEGILYLWLEGLLPVYLFTPEPEMPPYRTICVRQCFIDDPKPDPPLYHTKDILIDVSVDQYRKWEMDLRRQHQNGRGGN